MVAWGYEFYLIAQILSFTTERSERVRDAISTKR